MMKKLFIKDKTIEVNTKNLKEVFLEIGFLKCGIIQELAKINNYKFNNLLSFYSLNGLAETIIKFLVWYRNSERNTVDINILCQYLSRTYNVLTIDLICQYVKNGFEFNLENYYRQIIVFLPEIKESEFILPYRWVDKKRNILSSLVGGKNEHKTLRTIGQFEFMF